MVETTAPAGIALLLLVGMALLFSGVAAAGLYIIRRPRRGLELTVHMAHTLNPLTRLIWNPTFGSRRVTGMKVMGFIWLITGAGMVVSLLALGAMMLLSDAG